ncbi:MAG: substrate-binding domain-containing protein [Burkholderiales bacterium]|nr:substrate-binding domain-containing protein [Burkholderiales bacterium]
MSNPLRSWAAMAALIALSVTANAKDLSVFCAGAVKPVFTTLAPAWQARSGHTLNVSFLTAGEMRQKLAAGERPDLVIQPLESFAVQDGLFAPGARRDLGTVVIGVAIKAGAPLPDLSSEEGLKRTLLAARSVTFMDPSRGTSGKHFDEVVLPKLGLRDAVRAKAVLGQGGMIAEKVASGEVEIAFQQMTELLPVAGVTIAGVLPPSLQKDTVYSAAVMKASTSTAEATALLDMLSSAEARAVFRAKGFAVGP